MKNSNLGAILLNTLIFAYTNYTLVRSFVQIEKDLQVLKEMDNPKLRLTTSDLYGYLYTLNDKGIKYQRVEELDEKTKRFMYSWRLEVEFNEKVSETD